MFTPEQISAATGAPLANVAITWPQVEAALARFGIDDRPARIAAAATIATETGSFLPIPEEGNEAYFLSEFGSAYEAGYHGRGLIQLSWSYNYRKYGAEIGVDLLGNPDLALQPAIAADVLSLYFRDTGCPGLARAGNWYGVRRAVNGGLNGIATFMSVVDALLAVPEIAPAPLAPTVAVLSILRTAPVDNAAHAIDPAHQPVVLQVGTAVHFAPDPGGPYKGEIVTPHWCHVVVGSGPVHGWVQRANLRTGVTS